MFLCGRMALNFQKLIVILIGCVTIQKNVIPECFYRESPLLQTRSPIEVFGDDEKRRRSREVCHSRSTT